MRITSIPITPYPEGTKYAFYCWKAIDEIIDSRYCTVYKLQWTDTKPILINSFVLIVDAANLLFFNMQMISYIDKPRDDGYFKRIEQRGDMLVLPGNEEDWWKLTEIRI